MGNGMIPFPGVSLEKLADNEYLRPAKRRTSGYFLRRESKFSGVSVLKGPYEEVG